jgi:succinate dehydrogenase / fumarate reductase, iron-sulfur subunit
VAQVKVNYRIRRFDPDRGDKPWLGRYSVDLEPTDRVLDGLNAIKWHQDGTLTFRRSCAHGVCGSDAMVINGKNRLACKTLVRDVGTEIAIEPMRGYKVLKDLVVDLEPFFAAYRSVMPYLVTDEPVPVRERLQSPAERLRFEDTTKCILCAACTTSCPPFWANPEFVGPAAIVNAHRFTFDSRDRGAEERLKVLNQRDGVWRCRTVFNCTEACPRGIHITRAIEEVKRAILLNES